MVFPVRFNWLIFSLNFWAIALFLKSDAIHAFFDGAGQLDWCSKYKWSDSIGKFRLHPSLKSPELKLLDFRAQNLGYRHGEPMLHRHGRAKTKERQAEKDRKPARGCRATWHGRAA